MLPNPWIKLREACPNTEKVTNANQELKTREVMKVMRTALINFFSSFT